LIFSAIALAVEDENGNSKKYNREYETTNLMKKTQVREHQKQAVANKIYTKQVSSDTSCD
jgi:hypothetical protein